MEITEADSAENINFLFIFSFISPLSPCCYCQTKCLGKNFLNSRTCASLLLVSGVGGVQRPVAALRGASAPRQKCLKHAQNDTQNKMSFPCNAQGARSAEILNEATYLFQSV